MADALAHGGDEGRDKLRDFRMGQPNYLKGNYPDLSQEANGGN